MAVTIVSIIQVLAGAVLILFVLGQSGKHSGLGMISGASDSFLSKNKAKSADAKLARMGRDCIHRPDLGTELPVIIAFQNALPFWRGILRLFFHCDEVTLYES